MLKPSQCKEFATITFGVLLVSIAVYFFMIPSGIVVGSVSGLAIVFAELTPLSVSVLTFLLNGVLLIVGFLFIGKEFGAKTVYTSLLMPLYLWVFEQLIPLSESLTGNNVYDRLWTGTALSCERLQRRAGCGC